MNRYYEHLRFFCNTQLTENDRLLFLKDCGFTITTAKGVVSLYSAKAELIATYENAFVLDNGCICVKKSDCIDVYYNGEPRPSIIFDKDTKPQVRALTNAVVLIAGENKTETVYFVSPNSNVYRSFRIQSGFKAEATSVNGMVLTSKKFTHNRDEIVLYDQNEKPLELPPFYRVDFLPCGSYIVHFYDMVGSSVVLDGCALYNASHEKLLHARQSCQILPLGDKVVYEQSLIINPVNGRIINAYKGEKTVYGHRHIFAHEITGGMYSQLWIGGEMKAVMSDDALVALYYWKDGHIYFAPQCYHSVDNDIAIRKYVSDIYLTRIQELMS